MTPETTLKLATLLIMGTGIMLPALLLLGLLRFMRAPGWAQLSGTVLGLLVGAYAVFFHLFPDTLRAGSSGPKVTVEVVLPDEYRGFLYLYFDSLQPPLQPVRKGLYSLFVPPSGKLRAGQFPGQEVAPDNITYAFRHLSGTPARVAEGSLTGGGQARDGWSVAYVRPFIGSPSQFEAARRERESKGTWFDELEVLEQLRQAAKAPQKLEPATSLEGIERIP